MDFLEGVVERITYYNAENGYTVLRLSARGMPSTDLVTVVGALPEVTPGESLRLQGQWTTNAQYGKQFKADTCEQVLPATVEGIRKYLGSGLIKGVGPVTAQRIVKKFGADTLTILDQSPERIREVLGIGPKRAAAIAHAWEEQKSIKQVMVFLQSHGVTTGLAVKIYKQYGDAAIDLVQADPYRLAYDVYGIGFKTADKIAHDLGLPHDAPSRVAAGVVYTLSTLTDDGHVFAPQSRLIHDAAELLAVTPDQVAASFATLEQAAQIKRDVIYLTKDERRQADASVKDETAIYLTPFYQGEVNVAKRLNTIIGSPQTRLADLRLRDFQEELIALSSTVADHPTARLSDQQREAVKAALTNKITVLTGGPGTGKCVHGDTLVMTTDGLIPIKQLMPAASMPPDCTVPISTNVQSRRGIKTASHFYYGGFQETRRLATAEGYEIEGTPNHRVIVATEHGPAWRSLDQIQGGDYVAIFRSTPDYEFTFEPFAYFLGLFTGDGNAVRCDARPVTGVVITNADNEVWSFLEQELPKLTLTVNYTGESGQARKYYIGRGRSDGAGGVAAVMREWEYQLRTSREKTIPAGILRGTPSHKRSFLMGLFDSDGTADKRDGAVELGMSNYQLLRTIQLMLLEFGIIAILREKSGGRSWRLTCRGENARLFYDRIGFRIQRKQERGACLSDRPDTNIDVVPQLDAGLLRTYVSQTGPHERRRRWKWKREVKGERRPHRDRVPALPDTYKIDSPEESILGALCDSGIYWARVASNQPSQAEVYDLHVPDGHEFIANGFINHNTTTVRALIELLEKHHKRYALASPTGRAAKRLSQATNRSARTIHRLLEFAPAEGFKRNAQNPLDVDMLIVDEASMIDLLLMNHLLKAVPPDAHLLLVGDVDQLPSVGAGDVLRDIIASGRAAVIRLNVIFRQAQTSHIITNSHRINQGQMPFTPKDANDFFLFVKDDPDAAAELIVDLVAARIPAKFGLKPADIQVLSPMYRGATGVTNLNALLQAKLNPPAARKIERRLSGTLFRAGDRVLQTRNNYDKEVYNGDLGYVTAIDLENQTLSVSIDDRVVEYDWSEADELTLAYAISVHKAQGSEYPAVVMPLLTQHYLLLQRNLLYTGITRAKRLVVLVGSRRALAMAVKNNQPAQRYSGLAERLNKKTSEA